MADADKPIKQYPVSAKTFFYFIQNKKIKSVISSLVAGSVRVLAVVRLLAAVSVIPGKEGERELPPVGQQEK